MQCLVAFSVCMSPTANVSHSSFFGTTAMKPHCVDTTFAKTRATPRPGPRCPTVGPHVLLMWTFTKGKGQPEVAGRKR